LFEEFFRLWGWRLRRGWGCFLHIDLWEKRGL
jgi:hypothetical protein